jgi:ribosomal protein S18 acetylase RimI-like enzyme
MDAGMRGGMRRATVADAAAIARIHVETWRATYAGMLPDTYLVNLYRGRQAAGWRRMLAGNRGPNVTLVMEEAGTGVVGFASAGLVRPHDMPAGGAVRGEIYTLYVDGDAQGRGYGRALLQGVMASLFGNGLGDVVVWVLAANPSRFFYEVMGGAPLATRRERFAGAEIDEVGYVWRAPPGEA